ncbi:MAG: exodeoxyribonuclease VII large subunit [Chitinivibrionales bacterium]
MMNTTFSFQTPQQSKRPYSISQVNAGINAILESGNTFIWAEGEISNYKCAGSGHAYFKLKDAGSQIPAVLWRSNCNKLNFEPEDGMAVQVIATIRVYQRGGYYQLDVFKMQPGGIGALYAAFEKLKKKLEQEGLFDPSHKKPLPDRIDTVGVITAKTGAAIRDICSVISARAPQTHVLLHDVPVQGDSAPAAIVDAIRNMNEYGHANCLIVGRGGGSIEDLWAFNDEKVARAIYESDIPVISAVGHEIDFTIADFVADVRAPTPSAAAEMAVPDTRESRRYFEALSRRFAAAIERYFWNVREKYRSLLARPALKRPYRLLTDSIQHRDEAFERHIRAMGLISERYRTRLAHDTARLESLSPLAVLSRGYSVVTREGHPVRNARGQLSIGDTVELRFQSGEATAEIQSINHNLAQSEQ